jgi:PleD family two-component response regulator
MLTINGGLASFPRDVETIEQLFQQADKALLEAKRSGKNRIYLVGKPSQKQ